MKNLNTKQMTAYDFLAGYLDAVYQYGASDEWEAHFKQAVEDGAEFTQEDVKQLAEKLENYADGWMSCETVLETNDNLAQVFERMAIAYLKGYIRSVEFQTCSDSFEYADDLDTVLYVIENREF